MYSALPVWKVAPFFRILFFLVAGFLMQWDLGFRINYIIIISVITFCFHLLINFFTPTVRLNIRSVQGCFISMLIVLTGMALCWIKIPSHDNKWYGNLVNPNCYLLVTVTGQPVISNKNWKAEATVKAVITSKVVRSDGVLILYGEKKDCTPIAYGKLMVIKASLQEFPKNGNPGAFDYREYMASHGFFHRLQIKNNYSIVGNDSAFFQSQFISLRRDALGVLKKYITGQQNISLAEALLLGYKDDLDKEVVQAYSNTGVVHIIAVSGLHLGLIYLVLQKLLSFIPYLKRSRKFQFIAIIAGLWFFTFITGSAPSALRSAVMFSFIVAGKAFGRQHSIYNAIFSSAFFLLCFDPMYLKDVGFQLSYLAVISIVWLQQPVNKLIYIHNSVIKKLWSLISVSLVAQLFTTPLCIYYFHQFPNLFLLSNLVAVPVSTVILFGCILLVSVQWLHILAALTGKLLSISISFLNGFIINLDHIPFSATKHIELSYPEMWLIYFTIIAVVLWLLHKYSYMLHLFLLCCLCLMFLKLGAHVVIQKQYKLVIYKLAGYSAADYISKGKVFYCGDRTAIQDQSTSKIMTTARIIEHATFSNNILNPASLAVIFNNKLIIHVATAVRFKNNMEIPVDVLIISHNGVSSIYDLVPSIIPRLVIFDSSNSLWKIDKWINECEQLHLPFYSVAQNGAFVFNSN